MFSYVNTSDRLAVGAFIKCFNCPECIGNKKGMHKGTERGDFYEFPFIPLSALLTFKPKLQT